MDLSSCLCGLSCETINTRNLLDSQSMCIAPRVNGNTPCGRFLGSHSHDYERNKIYLDGIDSLGCPCNCAYEIVDHRFTSANLLCSAPRLDGNGICGQPLGAHPSQHELKEESKKRKFIATEDTVQPSSQIQRAYSAEENVNYMKDTLLHATISTIDGGEFLTLPNGVAFPVVDADSQIPNRSTLLIRSFHHEMVLVFETLDSYPQSKGFVFFGPPGIGKSWSSMYLLWYLLMKREGRHLVPSSTTTTSSESVINNIPHIIYFHANDRRAWIFGSSRNVLIKGIETPNETTFPELNNHDTILIYDAVAGNGESPLPSFNAKYCIFSSPLAGNFTRIESCKLLLRIYCPSWTLEELQLLAAQLVPPLPVDIVAKRYSVYGGSPRFVLGIECVAKGIFNRAINSWDCTTLANSLSATSGNWPIKLLKAVYLSSDEATTPQDAFEKYNAENVFWDFASTEIKWKIYAKYKVVDHQTKLKLIDWLTGDPKGASILGYFFESQVLDFFIKKEWQGIQVAPLEKNKGSGTLSITPRDWNLPTHITRVESSNIQNISDLSTLNDVNTVYKLPVNFPIMDFFNPPNNCFSLGVGDHAIQLGPALELCNVLGSNMNYIFVTPPINYDQRSYCQSFDNCKSVSVTPPYSTNQTIFAKLHQNHKEILQNLVQYRLTFTPTAVTLPQGQS